MLSNETKKIVSAPKRKALVGTVVIVVLFILTGFIVWRLLNSNQTLDINGHQYSLMVAKTVQAQEKGLGDRSSLPLNQGMLFVFNTPGVQCFWMKDMHFPLDIIWLGANKKVLFVLPDALPSSYPQNYCPNTQAKYVIELNAGQAREADIQMGQHLNF